MKTEDFIKLMQKDLDKKEKLLAALKAEISMLKRSIQKGTGRPS